MSVFEQTFCDRCNADEYRRDDPEPRPGSGWEYQRGYMPEGPYMAGLNGWVVFVKRRAGEEYWRRQESHVCAACLADPDFWELSDCPEEEPDATPDYYVEQIVGRYGEPESDEVKPNMTIGLQRALAFREAQLLLAERDRWGFRGVRQVIGEQRCYLPFKPKELVPDSTPEVSNAA